MCPPPTRWGRKARQPWTTPQKLTPITHSQALSGPNQASPRGATPALLHTRCTAPKRSTACSARALHLGLLADVGAHGEHLDAVRRHLRRGGRASASSWTSASTRSIPAPANRSASASPIPLPAPVTTATCPVVSSMGGTVANDRRHAWAASVGPSGGGADGGHARHRAHTQQVEGAAVIGGPLQVVTTAEAVVDAAGETDQPDQHLGRGVNEVPTRQDADHPAEVVELGDPCRRIVRVTLPDGDQRLEAPTDGDLVGVVAPLPCRTDQGMHQHGLIARLAGAGDGPEEARRGHAPPSQPLAARPGPPGAVDDGRTTSGRSPSWEMIRHTAVAVAVSSRRPVGGQHHARADREPGGTGAGQAGRLATDQQGIEGGRVVESDHGGVHVDDDGRAALEISCGLRGA